MANGPPLPPFPSDEEIDRMSPEQLQAIQKQYTPIQPKLQGVGALAMPDYNADVRKQIIPGLKEGAAGTLGAPADLASAGAAGLSALGAITPEQERDFRVAAAPWGQQGWTETKYPFVGQALKLSPEEQQPPKTFPGRVARSFASYLPSMVPLGATGFAGGVGRGVSDVIQALLRSGTGALASEGAGKAMELAGTPEAAPYARAAGAAFGLGPAQGFKANPKLAPSATMLEQAGFPVTAAERSGSRWAATLEQKSPNHDATMAMIDRLRSRQLDPVDPMAAAAPRQRVLADMGDVWNNAQAQRAPVKQVNEVNKEINRYQAATGKNADKPLSADTYFKLSQDWRNNPNPHVQQLGQVLDRHMVQQNPVWEGMADRFRHVPSLKALSNAAENVPFPTPRDLTKGIGPYAGVGGAAGAYFMGHPNVAENAALLGLFGVPTVGEHMIKAVAGMPGIGGRSALGQAWMKGWPTDPRLTYAALLAGPGAHQLRDVMNPQQQSNQ